MLSKLQTGEQVLTWKRKSDVSQIIVNLKAGARHEKESERGVSHVIRHNILGSNRYNTIISNTRALFHIGADVSVETSRDNISIRVACGSRYLYHVLDFIGSALSYPKNYYHEVHYALQSCLIDHDNLKANLLPEYILEELHEKLFRTGYGNSLYVRSDCLSKIREHVVEAYMNRMFSSDRLTVGVISDLSHPFIEEYVSECFELPRSPLEDEVRPKSHDGESVILGDSRYFHSAFGYPAPSFDDNKWAAFCVLQKYLGAQENLLSCTGSRSHLSSALDGTLIKASCFYIPYDKTGVFGFYSIIPPQNYSESLKQLCKCLNSVFTTGPTESDLKRAIALAKLDYISKFESTNQILTDAMLEVSRTAQLPQWEQRLRSIEEVSVSHIRSILKEFLDSKPVMVSMGDPSYIPALDDAVSWMKGS
ncbi:Cytochrome b-c1 complex subunit 2 [Thelohanellus kitauei]|uniref:Cytochrome b-c1 complex subunit 2 n=1 Tax=Thelohanellus kitauei TaxID=669202 RepID=A0A0C2IZX4_THEKT|nr:Cytochrome b-c1 complex subunit 2 [Thelohanellus kitauei]